MVKLNNCKRDVQDGRYSVLVVDDDPALRRLLRRELIKAGFRVQDSEPEESALGSVVDDRFDLLILGMDSPKGYGPAAIQAVRASSSIPILVLSASSKEDAVVGAFESGADDYVLKPFGIGEFLARVNNALRRRAREQGRFVTVRSGTLEIDLLHRRIRSGGRDLHLPPKSYEVLRALAENAGKVVEHRAILDAAWGPQRIGREGLRSAIRQLRCKLEANPSHPLLIVTEPGVGYRLVVSA